MIPYLVLFIAALWAGLQNALAGGGTFITLPALMATGMDALSANVTSTIALVPGQVTSCWNARGHMSGAAGLYFRTLAVISLVGGILGAVLLLVTPSHFFSRLVPWLVLFATVVFAWGSFSKRPAHTPRLGMVPAAIVQFLISIYGGYFGGGIGFLMLAALTAMGQTIRNAGATKNVLALLMNVSAVAIFAFSPLVHWLEAGVACAGAAIGGAIGGMMVTRVNEKLLRAAAVAIGVALTVGLFLKAP